METTSCSSDLDVGEPSEAWRTHQGTPMGTDLECRRWRQEAAFRLLNNNLDPEVAERPEALVEYGGSGQVAWSWEAYEDALDEAAVSDGRLPSESQ